MKSITVTKWGSMVISDRPPARLKHSNVRVRVIYAGVGRTDITAVRGGYLLAPRRPFSPGYEFVGTLESGTRVAGILPSMGAYRELIDLPGRWCVPIPDAVSDETAACLPLNYLTALALLEKNTRLQPGAKVLIHGAAGGVGMALLELARIKGLTAFGLASSGRGPEILELGGIPLDRNADWVTDAKQLTRSSHHRDFRFGEIDEVAEERSVQTVHEHRRHKEMKPKRKDRCVEKACKPRQSRANQGACMRPSYRQFSSSHTLKYAPGENYLTPYASSRSCREKIGLAPQGFDAVFDAQGVVSFRNSWSVLAPGGTLAAYGFALDLDGGVSHYLRGLAYLGAKAINLSGKRVAVCGLPGMAAADPIWYRNSMTTLFDLAVAGAIRPKLAGIYPWDRAAQVHELIAQGGVQGKFLLDFRL